MYRPTKAKLLRRAGVSALMAIGVAGASVGVANAATHSKHSAVERARSSSTTPSQDQNRCDHAGGKVTAVTASSLTVSRLDGTTATYAITSSTTVTKDGATATASDISVGDLVRVEVSSASSTTATAIEIDSPHVGGQVTSIGTNSFVISTPFGLQTTVNVSSSTTYTVGSTGKSASLSDLKVGSFVMVSGSVSTDHTTVNATSVVLGIPSDGHGPRGEGHGFGGPGPRGGGRF